PPSKTHESWKTFHPEIVLWAGTIAGRGFKLCCILSLSTNASRSCSCSTNNTLQGGHGSKLIQPWRESLAVVLRISTCTARNNASKPWWNGQGCSSVIESSNSPFAPSLSNRSCGGRT